MIGRRKPIRNLRRRLTQVALALVPLLVIPLIPRLLATSGDTPSFAEAIYVFPGQVPERAECAARLYDREVAPRVVFSGEQIAPELTAIGQPIPDASLNARVAREHGVPENALVVVNAGTSTWEDALVLGQWMRETGTRRVIAVTSPTHSRRALYTLRFALGDLADGVHVYRCGAIYGPLWWTRERSLVRVTLEALKFVFYGARYFLPAACGLTPAGPPPQNQP